MPTGHEDGGRKGVAVYLRALLGGLAHVWLSPDHPRGIANDPAKVRDHRHDGKRGFSQVAKQARQISHLQALRRPPLSEICPPKSRFSR